MSIRFITYAFIAVEWLAGMLGVTPPAAAVVGGLIAGAVPAGLAGKIWGAHVDAPQTVACSRPVEPWQAPRKPEGKERSPFPDIRDFLPGGR